MLLFDPLIFYISIDRSILFISPRAMKQLKNPLVDQPWMMISSHSREAINADPGSAGRDQSRRNLENEDPRS